MYPLLVLSEESTDMVDAEVQSRVGTQGIDERWRYENVVIERYVLRACAISLCLSDPDLPNSDLGQILFSKVPVHLQKISGRKYVSVPKVRLLHWCPNAQGVW